MSLASCAKLPNNKCLKVSVCSKLLHVQSVVFQYWVTYIVQYGAYQTSTVSKEILDFLSCSEA